MGGAGIIGHALGRDVRKIHLCESKMKDRPRGFCSIAFAPMIRVEFVTHITFKNIDRIPANAAITNQLTCATQTQLFLAPLKQETR
jgi:hypothetical protein